MSIPNSTPFPVATFDSNAGDGSAKQFLDFLHTLISENLDSDPPLRIPATSRGTWVPVIAALSDHFLASLPSHRTVPWNAMHEKVKLVEITLEVVQRVTDRVDALYAGPGNFASKIFTRLLNLCICLDVWVDVVVPEENDIPTPLQLRQKTVQVAVSVLRCLGSNVVVAGGSDEHTWKMLRNIVTQCLEVINGMEAFAFTFPMILTDYQMPCL
jgi:serine/threonine-protein kinase ATR